MVCGWVEKRERSRDEVSLVGGVWLEDSVGVRVRVFGDGLSVCLAVCLGGATSVDCLQWGLTWVSARMELRLRG
jgi:hypothetical protein